MIVKWKMITALELTATWEGRRLELLWRPEEQRWRVRVDGRLTKGAYASSVAAIEAVEGELNKLLRARSVTVQAQQRASRETRIVRLDTKLEAAYGASGV